MREDQALRAAAFDFSVDAIFEVEAGLLVNAAMRFRKQIGAFSVDDGVRGANSGAGRLRGGGANDMAAEFALDDFGIDHVPFEFRNVEGAGDLAVAAADTESGSSNRQRREALCEARSSGSRKRRQGRRNACIGA